MTAATGSRRKTAPHVQRLYDSDACRGARCSGSAVWWVDTAAGRPIPLDVGRDPAGPIVVDKVGESWVARAIRPGDHQTRPRYTVHWSSCGTPGMYVDVRNAADPLRELPTLVVEGGETAGQCAICRAWFPTRYGETSTGPLCDVCGEEVRARWSPAFRRAQGLPDLPIAG